MTYSFPYERVNERAILDLSFKAVEPLHVGSGTGELLKEVLKIGIQGKDKFIIPSNSVKGVLRQLGTQIARSMYFDDLTGRIISSHSKEGHRVSSATQTGSDTLDNNTTDMIEKMCSQEVKSYLQSIDDDEQKRMILASLACPVCLLFGSKAFASKLLIGDMLAPDSYTVGTYTSVSISRKKRTAEAKRLFSIEFVYGNNLTFKIMIVADNLEKTKEGSIFSNVLEYIIKSGIKFGGLKSRGYGLMKLDPNSIVKFIKFENGRENANLRKLLLIDGFFEQLTVEQYAERIRQ